MTPERDGWHAMISVRTGPQQFLIGGHLDRFQRQRPCHDLSRPSPRVIAKARPEIDVHAKKFIDDVAVLRARHVGLRRQRRCLAARRQSRLHPCRRTEPAADAGSFRQQPHRQLSQHRRGSGLRAVDLLRARIDETLRVGGKGKLSADPELMASMVEFGKPPRAVLRIDVREVYFHCGKALMRSKLWAGDAGRALGDAEHRRSDPRPDRPRRAGKPGRRFTSGTRRSCRCCLAVMPGLEPLDPGIHDLLLAVRQERGWPGQARP